MPRKRNVLLPGGGNALSDKKDPRLRLKNLLYGASKARSDKENYWVVEQEQGRE